MRPDTSPACPAIPRLNFWIVKVVVAFTILVSAQSIQAQQSSLTNEAFDASTTNSELLDKARSAVGLQEFQLAETYYQEILIRDTANLVAMLELSNVYERIGRLEYARGLLMRASTLDPTNTRIEQHQKIVEQQLGALLTNETEELIAADQFEQAIPKISLHMSFDKNNAKLHYDKAICLLALEQYDAALSDIDAAIQLNQQELYFELRGEITASRTAAQSRRLTEQIERLASSSLPGDWEKGISALGSLIAIDPENQWARETFTQLNNQLTASEPDDGIAATTSEKVIGRGTWVSFLTPGTRWITDLLKEHLTAILLFIAIVLVFRSPLTRSLIDGFTTKPILLGQLVPFSLPEILLMINAEPHNGVLQVKGEGCSGNVYIEGGEPRHCTVGKLDGVEALTHLLNNSDSGSFAFKDGAISIKRTIEKPLSLILIENARKTSPTKEKAKPARKSRMKELLDSQV